MRSGVSVRRIQDVQSLKTIEITRTPTQTNEVTSIKLTVQLLSFPEKRFPTASHPPY